MMTSKEREQLAEARATVARLQAKEGMALGAVVDAMRKVPGMDTGKWQAADLAKHAGAIRDALAPFDNGERCANEVAA